VDPTQRLKLENEKKQEKIDQLLEAKTREKVIETTKTNEELEKHIKRMEELMMQTNFPKIS